MRVKYALQNLHSIENKPSVKEYLNRWLILPDSFALTFGKEYTVYAIRYTKEGYERFYICDESGSIYPKSYPSEFFKVTDNRLSKFWGINEKEYPIKIQHYPKLITFNEWKENEFFEEEMIENEGGANEVFKKYKETLDFEYSNSEYPTAESIDDCWFLCSQCNHTWESISDLELIQCPNCLTVQNKL